MVNINIKTVIFRTKRFLSVTMLHQFRFAHPSWGHEANIFTTGKHLHETLGFFFTVTKIRCRNITSNNERISYHIYLFMRQIYANYPIYIILLPKLYYTKLVKTQKGDYLSDNHLFKFLIYLEKFTKPIPCRHL